MLFEFSKSDELNIVESVEVISPETVFHLHRVSKLNMIIAQNLGFDENCVAEFGLAGLLHDVGKFAIPFSIIGKANKLSDTEYNLVKIHSQRGALIAKNEGDIPDSVVETILHHHERWDGNGYPFGLKEKSIPLGARVLSVSDTMDALASNRPYRKKLSQTNILIELKRVTGTQLDPDIVELAFDLIHDKKIMVSGNAI